jgi:hypothetical protein
MMVCPVYYRVPMGGIQRGQQPIDGERASERVRGGARAIESDTWRLGRKLSRLISSNFEVWKSFHTSRELAHALHLFFFL